MSYFKLMIYFIYIYIYIYIFNVVICFFFECPHIYSMHNTFTSLDIITLNFNYKIIHLNFKPIPFNMCFDEMLSSFC
jgi:hypothetical protein